MIVVKKFNEDTWPNTFEVLESIQSKFKFLYVIMWLLEYLK